VLSSRFVRLALHGLSILSCVVLAAVTALELLGPRWHPLAFALAAALPVHFLLALLALSSSLIARRPHLLRAALALTGVLIAVQADALLSASAARSQPSSSDITLVSANVFAGNDDFELLAASISRQGVDVLVTVETSKAAEAALSAALPGYSKVSATAARWVPQDNVVVWSKLPITSLAPVVIADRELPLAEVMTKSGPLRVLGVHLSSPTNHSYVQRLNNELDALAQLDLGDTPLVLAGDFNTPTRHPALRDLTLGRSRLADAGLATGNIFAATWPAISSEAPIPSPVPVLDIDHVLLSRTTVSAFSVINLPGSDHRGLAVRIRPAP
jgi:endonuclease/exonuclease/phosphatase (EEP) superfamily protein YafD